MAEIDKALPNVKQTVTIPGTQEVELEQQEKLKEQDDEEPISDDVFADLEGGINDMFDLEGTCPSDPAMNKKMMGDRQPDNLKNQD